MIVAVDAAGGDYYPQNPVKGAIEAVEENNELTVILVGPEDIIKEELANHEYDKKRVLIHDAPQVIGMDESPGQAVKTKQQSSIVVGVGLHKAGKCDAFVSAGNTGALLAASMFILGKLPGVLRPTIAAYYPTFKGFRLLVDAGANLEIKPETALQFAKMGSVFCEQILDISNPKVGLLNVGEEEAKGTELLKEVHKELKSLDSFVGNLEGKDIFPGKADVYVCDGMVGNIVLKFGESIPDMLEKMIGMAVQKMELSSEEVQRTQKILKTALSSFNYENVGGIPFLGVNGVSVVGHGGSSPLAIKNMIKSAVQTVEQDVNGKIVASLN
ncbi:phosphate acyltransferase PlsX [Gracilimonas mengyeensis]|uniref:Phosphate acyltransferase n=1 Tax=Gracilimonas mengyeensis TaxID=1302730 RepID=A0A521DSV4_9BACT|nr:phosphate acyltransferase PlsX [Gracilimonas mengyeensis]SMO74797.1 phosphate:acyl-[acyl carrier protein] acyltransferase [Gracilimonas mengyeensis]